MSFFVITIATLSLYRGLVYLWTNSNTIDTYGERVSAKLGNDAVLRGHVPIGLLLALGVVALLYLVLRYTTFGRAIYAVGERFLVSRRVTYPQESAGPTSG